MTSLAEKLRTSSESIQNILSETNRDLMEMFQSPDFRQSMMQPEYISRLHGSLYLQPEGSARGKKSIHTSVLSMIQGFYGSLQGKSLNCKV